MESLIYRERVLPSAATFLLPLVLAILSFAMLLPLSETAAWLTSLALAAFMTAILLFKAPQIRVSPEFLAVGRARISRKYIGKVAAVSSEQSFAERGHLLDANAFTSIQGSIKIMVKVEIVDPKDPAPYWLFTTRHPDELVAALS
jgi:hypothetical protein